MNNFLLEAVTYRNSVKNMFVSVKADNFDDAVKKAIPIVQASNLGGCYRFEDATPKEITHG